MRMIQAVNQGLGSPTNRVNILAHWAAEGLRTTSPTSDLLDERTRSTLQLTSDRSALSIWLGEKRKLWTFKIVLVFIDLGFVLSKVRQYWIRFTTGREEGFEDLLQRQITQMARDEFGVEVDDTAFAG